MGDQVRGISKKVVLGTETFKTADITDASNRLLTDGKPRNWVYRLFCKHRWRREFGDLPVSDYAGRLSVICS